MFGNNAPDGAEILALLGMRPTTKHAPTLARPKIKFTKPRFVPTGSISAPDPTIRNSIQQTLAGVLSKAINERQAHRLASRAMAPLTDATPLGNVTGAEEGGKQFYRGLTRGDLGTMALGAGSFLLSAAPLPGGVKRAGKRVGTGMFGSMLKDTRGTFGGQLAANADLKKLKAARGMERSAHPWDIHDETGWSRGVDGKWRFEVDDSAASVKGRAGKLADVLEHPELFAAYPQLADIPVHNFMPGGGASYERAVVDGVPLPGMIWMGRDVADDRYKSILSHEIQHAVQDIEGFAAGGGRADLGLDKYRQLAGEVEARNVQRRLGMTGAQRFELPFWLTQDTPTADQRVWFVGDLLGR